jgi:hypothetical protein
MAVQRQCNHQLGNPLGRPVSLANARLVRVGKRLFDPFIRQMLPQASPVEFRCRISKKIKGVIGHGNAA